MSYKLSNEYKQLKKFEANYEELLMKEIYRCRGDEDKK
jgi:hypothetical protein